MSERDELPDDKFLIVYPVLIGGRLCPVLWILKTGQLSFSSNEVADHIKTLAIDNGIDPDMIRVYSIQDQFTPLLREVTPDAN